jgi:threonyl-tRNA synthetase
MSTASMITTREALEKKAALRPDTIAAKVTDRGETKVRDLMTPIPEGAEVAPISASDPAGLAVIRHSSAHVMADAVQRLYPGTKVAFGPATENGFFYDYDRKAGPFTDEELRDIEKKMAEIIEGDLPFRREVVSADEARTILTKLGETYKLEHLERLAAAGESISLYRHGDWLDLCEGPHVPSTKFLKAFQLTTTAGAYWRGDERNPMLQRIYGTAFADAKALRTYLHQMEEAKKRDHRKLGKELELVGFHPWAPASPFFLPRGAKIYQLLVDYVRQLYVQYGYDEVVTPQVFDKKLFETSGHLPNYAENMYFAVTREDFEQIALVQANADAKTGADAVQEHARFGVKPMNCPGHCLFFGMERRSYRALPMRIADFGRLHRFERSGVTQGLTRVRTFCQDDAHVFCTSDQMQGEIESFIDLVYQVYRDFGFTEVRVVIATRPEQRLGTDEVWDRSEKALVDAVKAKGLPFELADGEGAFYGPKIEFHLKDAIGRSWQLGTMQVDFNMPERFDLSYVSSENTMPRPIMLHRAILGSIERFFGVLTEHVGGAFPTWLAPEQIAIITVHESWDAWANEAAALLRKAGIRVTVDLSTDKLGAKIKAARNMRIPYRAVVGEKETASRSLGLTVRDGNQELGAVPIDEVIARLRSESLAPSFRS